jgi:hypothetical protein
LLNLELPFGRADLLFEQLPLDVSMTVLRTDGDFDVRVIKAREAQADKPGMEVPPRL